MRPVDLFFELIEVLTGTRSELSGPCSEAEWEGALRLAAEQTVAGVLFRAVERLPKAQYPPKLPTLHWWQMSETIRRKSVRMKEAGEKAVAYFRENGFACQILKGTAVARYYPEPELRSCGDIDVWLDGGREKIYAFARAFDPDGMLYGVNYQHVHFHLFEDIPLEVHVYPSCLSSPILNHRLHRFFEQYPPTMDSDMPQPAFDRVFILLHCYQHINGHGVGLRQIMDYYYVLLQGATGDEKAASARWIRKLGMGRFAAGVMWVLQHTFGMPSEYLLMEPDEREGRFILQEILLTGNMGHSEKRHWGSTATPLSRFFFNLRRDVYLARHYPHEALWQPFFSIWLYFWRLFKGLLKSRDTDDD